MSLPYENATSGERALGEIQKFLRGFGCSKFGSMVDDEAREIIVQFQYRERMVSVKASVRGYAAAWLKAHPYNPSRSRCTRVEHERTATCGTVRRSRSSRSSCRARRALDVIPILGYCDSTL